MRRLKLHEARKEFLDFFKNKDHLVVPSFSLIPQNDKSLLLIGAGMAPLKPYFTKEAIPPSPRMATSQKCTRTGDIENVGKTDRHATFFEMLGNFSFGDYFKEEAIEWAYEFLTEVIEIPKEIIWATIYEEDDEAERIWVDKIGLPKDRVVRLGKEDNFWELEVGPSGPCTEIHVDRGPEHGCGSKNCKPGCDCDRYMEIWNLVFTQFDKDEEGNYNPLPNPNIDTGMGLERLVAYLQDVKTIFDIDIFEDLRNSISNLSGVKYGSSEENDIKIRVIIDHIRTITFLVSDGVVPSNEGRGYVLRRILRRASRIGNQLGIEGEFLSELSDIVIDLFKCEYKELDEKRDHIKRIISSEEAKFHETIDQGLSILDNYIDEMLDKGEKVLSGEDSFRLYDTYGFPLELTREILQEKNLTLDEEGFKTRMEEQRSRARQARSKGDSGWASQEDILDKIHYNTKFMGYNQSCLKSNILALYSENGKVDELVVGDSGLLILEETPFYAESGGQVGDSGSIEGDGFKLEVTDTQYAKDKTIVHFIKILDGVVKGSGEVEAKLDIRRRSSISKNHTATHLLHQALKDVLGDHVKQAGSVVDRDRLRFDFTHFSQVSQEELKSIEKIVNEKILEAIDVEVIETTLTNAEELGAIGLFEDKYGDNVRVLKIGDYSIELCGGAHVKNTSLIGMFKIIQESSIASGVRRIEAITGEGVYKYLEKMEDNLELISKSLKANNNEVLSKLEILLDDIKEKDKLIDSLESKLASGKADILISKVKEINEIPVLIYRDDSLDMNGLRNLSDEIKSKIESILIILASSNNGKVSFIVSASDDLVKKGIHSGNLVKEIASLTGGSGGGRPQMAQAGGKDESKIDYALKEAESLIRNFKLGGI